MRTGRSVTSSTVTAVVGRGRLDLDLCVLGGQKFVGGRFLHRPSLTAALAGTQQAGHVTDARPDVSRHKHVDDWVYARLHVRQDVEDALLVGQRRGGGGGGGVELKLSVQAWIYNHIYIYIYINYLYRHILMTRFSFSLKLKSFQL